MSDIEINPVSPSPVSPSIGPAPSESVITASRLPFRIAAYSFVGLVGLIFIPAILTATFHEQIYLGPPLNDVMAEKLGPTAIIFAQYIPHLFLFIITLASAYIGFKLVVASGAAPENPIPAANYPLLAPLITQGKSEAIELYVKLSSLSGFTGTFTKLGLPGLPLATIVLTLIFAGLALLPTKDPISQNFLDLTKLTLGAFLGSFVQRQVEQRKVAEETPPPSVK